MREINCYIPIKVRITSDLGSVQAEQLEEALTLAVARRIALATREMKAREGRIPPPQFHRPVIALPDTLSHDQQADVRALVYRSIRRATQKSTAGDEGSPIATRLDYSSGSPRYHLTSYNAGGATTSVLVATQQAAQVIKRPALVYFGDGYSILTSILDFYPNPLPHDNTYYGVYGIWAATNTPKLFWVTGQVSEGPLAGRYLIDSLPLVTGGLKAGRFVPSEDVPMNVTLGARYRLDVLLKPHTARSVPNNATLRQESGGRVEPFYMTQESFTRHRGKTIHFGVPAAEKIIGTVGPGPAATAAVPAAPPPREAPWAWVWLGQSLPAEPQEGISPEVWWWYGWLNVREADVRANPLVQAVFADWARRHDIDPINLLMLSIHYKQFYKEFCQRLTLGMLATSQQNMTDFLGLLNRDAASWLRRFTGLIQGLHEPASKLHAIVSRRAGLEQSREYWVNQLILSGRAQGPLPYTGADTPEMALNRRQIREHDKALAQLQQLHPEEERLSNMFQMIQGIEPILVLLTLQQGQTVRTLEGGLVWAADLAPEQVLQHIQHEMQWLIRKNNQATQEIRNDADIAYKLQFVQKEANAQLASWMKADHHFREAVETLIKGGGLLAWILGGTVLVLTFLFPPAGIILGLAVSGGMAIHSVMYAAKLSRISGTRLAQYEFAPLVTQAEVDAAIQQASIDVFFALVDVYQAADAVRGFMLAKRLTREAARDVAGALGRSLERTLLGWRRFDLWPDKLVLPLRRRVIEQLGRAKPAWRTGMSLEQSIRHVDELVETIQHQLVTGYERRLLEFQGRFERALQAEEVDIQAWLAREFPEGSDYFQQQIREELVPGKSLYEDTLGRRLAGQAPLPVPRAVAFLGQSTQTELAVLTHELGQMADLLNPNRLYALGRSTALEYAPLARRLNAILGRVEQPDLVLAQLENLLVGHPEAGAFLTALESVPNPRQILGHLTPEALSAQLNGGVHELIQAAGRSSGSGQIIRLFSDLDEKGIRRLFREVRRPDGRSFFSRWDGQAASWLPEGRIRAASPGPLPQAVVSETERAAALSRLEAIAARTDHVPSLAASFEELESLLDALRSQPSQEILDELANVAVREGNEVASNLIHGLARLENGAQVAELQAVGDFLRRGGEGRALAAILNRHPTWGMRSLQRPFLALLPSLQPNELRGISLIFANRGFTAEGAEAVLAITVRNYKSTRASVLGALGELAPHSEGLSGVIGYLASFEPNLNQAAEGVLVAAKRLLEERPDYPLIFEVPVSGGGRVVDIRVITPYTRITALDVEVKEVTNLFTLRKEHARQQFARDIVRSVKAARAGEAPLARIRWMVREQELLQQGLTHAQVREQIFDQLRQAFSRKELYALTQPEWEAAVRDFEANLERVVQLF